MAKGKKVPTITLILDEKEAEWLRDVMQNQFLHDETAKEYELRSDLFHLLDNLLKK